MKKLTAGIFATLLTVVSVGAANANIASQGYVDEKVGTVTTALGNKADKTELGNYATTAALTSGLAGKLDTEGTAAKATADASGNVITTTYATKKELDAKADTADLGALATKDTVSATEIDADAVTTEKILDANVTKAKLASDVQASLGKANSALQQSALADYAKTADVASTYETKENAASTYETKANASATYETKANASATYETKANASATYETKTNAAATYATKEEIAGMATDANLAKKQDKNMGPEAADHVVITDETGNITSAATIEAAKVSGLANVAKTGAYSDLTGTPSLGALASKSTITSDDITNGTIAEADLNTTINASLDKADTAVQPSDIANMQTTTKLTKVAGWEGAKSSDDNYPSNAAVNAAITSATSGLATDSKMGDLSSLTTTVQTNLVGAINEVDANADAAKAAADAAQEDATQAINDAATAQEAADTAQTTAEAKIPLPDGECSNPTAKCVLVSNGTNSFEWEVIARDGDGE